MRRLRASFVAIPTVMLALMCATSARSADTTRVAGSCSGQQLSQPFLPWLDSSNYAFVGDGGFESGAKGWTLKGGAGVVSGNEPWRVHAAADSRSLNLPSGAKATSPATCIGLLHPTTRFFARSLGGTLKIDATVTVLGISIPVPIGVVFVGSSFAPSLPLPLLANLTTLLSGSSGSVTLTFTAVGGAVQIDDLYIDPFKVN